VCDDDISESENENEDEPVTDNRYGFVRNPVKNGTLMVKFPRDEVSEVLEVGENVTIYITAETKQQELLTGMDETNVIRRPPGNRTPECTSNGGRGPPNGTPGQGPPGELPGRGPPDCSEEDNRDDDGDREEDGPEGDGVDYRRDSGRGESPPKDDQGDIGRGDFTDDGRRDSSGSRRSRGR